ncbi:wax ester/triacylglycerol synthase family O-acyltransferase [Streptomyces sp. NPDC059578]|uniref:wax ester/triacylglycerol synthase family O-acyltransferase n=1 Tax=Streptomyces sp. NPDC059578 TaxID=3346874 RepID=UPI0036965B29
MGTDPLAPLDLAFWNMESARHPMHMGALGVFAEGAPGAARHAAELLATRAAAVPGLRMRIRDVTVPLGGAAREPSAHFDPAEHVRLSDPVSDFHSAAGHAMSRPLDRTKPPWEALVLPAAEDDSCFAVLFKFHHALADGMRALTLAAGMMDPIATEERPHRATGPGPRRAPAAGATPLAERLRGAAAELTRALDIGAAVARATWDVRSSPALTSRPTGTRRTAGVLLDLDDVHRIRKTVGGTVNDVVLALVAGALRRWLDGRGDGDDRVRPRALVPVSRRRSGTGHPHGNRLSGYLLRLPVDEGDPLARLRAVRTAMDRNKEAGPQRGAGAVALLADHLPALGHRVSGPVVAQAARLLFDILVTSVPLPSLGLRLGGCPLTEVYPLAPLAHGQSVAVAVSTYRGGVHIGLVADALAVPDLDALADDFGAELSALRQATAV